MNIELVNKINASGYKAFFAITGGGQSFIGDYCSISGASKSFIGGIVPYNQVIFDKFINGKVDQYASSEAARKLAVASYYQCLSANVDSNFAIGIGAASSIASDGEREGRKHRVNIAAHTLNGTWVIEIVLNQGRPREHEDSLISILIFELFKDIALNKFNSNIFEKVYAFNSPNGETGILKFEFDQSVKNIFSGLQNIYCTKNLIDIERICVFPGSFNPPHFGHLEIKKIAEKALNSNVFFEISIKNADKGMLDFIEVANRRKMLNDYDYILTSAPTIKEKVDLIKNYSPNAEIVIVLGVDTWARVWDNRYGYALPDLEKFFETNNVKFLVFGRNNAPFDLTYGKNLIINVPEAVDFNNTLRSSDIRKQKI